MNQHCVPSKALIAKRDYIVFFGLAMSSFAALMCYALFFYHEYPFENYTAFELIGFVVFIPIACSLHIPFILIRINRICSTVTLSGPIKATITDISFLLYAYSVKYSFTYDSSTINHEAIIIGRDSMAIYDTTHHNSINVSYNPRINKHESFINEVFCPV